MLFCASGGQRATFGELVLSFHLVLRQGLCFSHSILQTNWPTKPQADFLFAFYLIIKVLRFVHQLSTCVHCVSRIKTQVIRLAEQAFSFSKSSPWP